MRGGWRFGALLAGLMIVGACTLQPTSQTPATPTTNQASVASPSAAASPSASPSPVESPSPTPDASPSPTPAPSPTRLIITSLSYNVGEVGIGYSAVTAGASGGTPPYKWSIDGGALPDGLGMSSGGTVSGTPGTSGGFSFVVRVDDAGGQAAGVPRSISIVPHVATTGLCATATPCSVEQGCVTVCGAYANTAGGVTPYSYAIASGAVPPGTSLNGASLAGMFTTPSPPGTAAPAPFMFTVTVTDAFGATSAVSAAFLVYQHIAVANGACYGNYGTGCSVQLAVTGGTPNVTPTVTLVSESQNPTPNPPGNNPGSCWVPSTTTPPPGYGLTPGSGIITVSIPSALLPGYGAVWTVVATDTSLCGPSTNCSSPAATVIIGVQCG